MVFSGAYSGYTLAGQGQAAWTVTDTRANSPDGALTLTSIQHLQFTDSTLTAANAPSAATAAKIETALLQRGARHRALHRGAGCHPQARRRNYRGQPAGRPARGPAGHRRRRGCGDPDARRRRSAGGPPGRRHHLGRYALLRVLHRQDTEFGRLRLPRQQHDQFEQPEHGLLRQVHAGEPLHQLRGRPGQAGRRHGRLQRRLRLAEPFRCNGESLPRNLRLRRRQHQGLGHPHRPDRLGGDPPRVRTTSPTTAATGRSGSAPRPPWSATF